MSTITLISDTERMLVRMIRLGLGCRYPAKASTEALAAMPITVLSPGALVPVTGIGLYEWDPHSTATADGVDVVASTTLPAGKTNGRWLKVSTAWTWGAGGQNLAQKTSGFLKVVEAMDSDDGEDEAAARIFNQTPSVLVAFTNDVPESLAAQPGTWYRTRLEFTLLIFSTCFRPSPAATWGSPFPAESAADPGAFAILGSLRHLFMSNADPGVDAIARIELGRTELAAESEDRRVFVWRMALSVLASFSIDDEDGAETWEIVAQPALSGAAEGADAFDAENYVRQGGDFAEALGAGLARTLRATAAKIGGVEVTAAEQATTLDPDSDVWRDLGADGWHLTALPAGSSPPVLAAGRLRVGVSRTDASGVLFDRYLAAYSLPEGDPVVVGVEA